MSQHGGHISDLKAPKRSSLVARRVKDRVLLPLCLGLLLWCRFHPWPRNFRSPWGCPPRPKRQKKKKVKALKKMVKDCGDI